MTSSRLLSEAATVLVIAGLLTGCSGPGRGVSVPAGAEQLEQCVPQVIDADALATMGKPGCDLEGASVEVPDGPTLEVRPVEVVSSQQSSDTRSVEYLIVNWSVPGVAVSSVEDGSLTDLWASSPAAEELQHQQMRLDGIRES